MASAANYLDFLYELDRYTRSTPRGCVLNGAEMHSIAQDAGLAELADTLAAAWTGQLVKHGYVSHAPAPLGTRRPYPPPGPWTDEDLQAYNDYEVTDTGREEAERIGRLRRDAATDAALGIGPSWLDDSQLEAVGTQLHSLRSALDAERWVDAVGAAKNLVEASCKVVLAQRGQAIPTSDALPVLFRRAYDALAPSTHRSVVDLGRALAGAVQRVGELRTAAGAGHGQAEVASLTPREARLAASAAVAVTRYLLEAPATPNQAGGVL
jgi:hypothetical protein